MEVSSCAARGLKMGSKFWFVALLSVTISACGSAVSLSRNAASPAYVTASTVASNHVIPSLSTINSSYGRVLASQTGYAYYIFELDSPTTSNCNASCSAVWPPVVGSSPVISGGVKKSLVGSITLSDGAKMVTYNGHPLYTFMGDTAPKSTAGQGVYSFGAAWYLIAANGQVITSKAPSSNSATGS